MVPGRRSWRWLFESAREGTGSGVGPVEGIDVGRRTGNAVGFKVGEAVVGKSIGNAALGTTVGKG